MAQSQFGRSGALSDMGQEPEKTGPQETAAPADSASISIRLRDTWLGQFYFNHLKKYRIVKLLAPWVWRKVYFIYQLAWIFGKALKRPLVPLSAYAATNGRALLSKAETVTTPLPGVFPESARKHLITSHSEYEFPEIYIAEVRKALVTGGTNLVMTDDSIICHDLYDFTHDYTSEELNGRTYIWPHRQRIAWLMRTAPYRELTRAACFTDACASNYAHWMTEVLPRINLFCRAEESPEVPLIINDGLHKNLMESLYAVAGSKREIVALPTGTGIQVEHLSLTSVAGYVPFERRSNRLKNHSHGRFSPFAILSMRQCLQERLDIPSGPFIRRVYIKRNSGIRNITNAREIEALLVAHGFSVIEPEFLTHAQQVALFSNADVVVGATGAAMANLIFCKPTAKIIIMISNYQFMPYWYWQNMACTVGNRVTYVFGKCMGPKAYLHSNFKVNTSDVLDAIDAAQHG
jgi:capsular polysaccharide biosynthesis protein